MLTPDGAWQVETPVLDRKFTGWARARCGRRVGCHGLDRVLVLEATTTGVVWVDAQSDIVAPRHVFEARRVGERSPQCVVSGVPQNTLMLAPSLLSLWGRSLRDPS